MDWSNENIVITGGAGFIGSHLVDRLRAFAQALYVVDDLSRGRLLNIKPMPDLMFSDSFTQMSPYTFAPILGGKIVFHLAAKVAGIHYNVTHNLDMMESNIGINSSLVKCIRVGKELPKLLIWVSTACVYPHDAPVPTPEDAAEVCDPEPTNFGYGVAKWVGEQQALFLCKEYGIPTIIVRFFNAFGPRDYYDEATSHVTPALIRRVMEGKNPLVVWGSGTQTRALVDARDIAKALVMLAETQLEIWRSSGDKPKSWQPIEYKPIVVNIGHEREISIGALADTITDVAYSEFDIPKPTLEFDTSKPDGYPRRAADTTRLRSLIGWVPDMPLEQTLEDMMRDYLYQKEMGWIDDIG